MSRKALILPIALLACGGLATALAFFFAAPDAEIAAANDDASLESGAPPELEREPGETDEALEARRQSAEDAMLDADYPNHGLVTAPQLIMHERADATSAIVGWLRLGGRVRLAAEPQRAPNCNTGWYAVYPRGFACAGQGIEVGAAPSGAAAGESAADVESALPYRYMLVREPQVPEYHQLPSRDQQRAAIAHGDRYAALLNAGQERQAERLRTTGIAGEPPMPTAVARYLQRGFYVASNGTEERSSRRFVRTVRGSYIKEAQLIDTTGSAFHGIELDEETTLPLAFALRTSQPMRRELADDGTSRMRDDEEIEAWERQTVVPWLRRERIGDQVYHVLEGPNEEERYARAWFIGVAEVHEPPSGLDDEEPWVHIDVSEQTLVLYRGATPAYVTLVSTGVEGHDTPIGEFTIRRKFVSDTMANLGADTDDNYRIDDVPWTQYFEGSVALHAAFWHHRFGLRQSHGCVNLAPRDARYVFEHTWPRLPTGWHGVSTERGAGFQGSRVVVTE